MRQLMTTSAMMMTLWLVAPGWASEAATSAGVSGNRYGPGTAHATASYVGDRGFARTDTQSGKVNLARGVAVGIDKDGLSLSVSHAVDAGRGPALATNFNMSIGRDGSRSVSLGAAVADGRLERAASAGGSTAAGRNGSVALSTASGHTDRFGRVRVVTKAENHRPGPIEVRRYVVRR
jgi:hypothetical protein